MRTIEEIREFYRQLEGKNAWGGYADAITLLDYIAELEAQNAALQAQVGAWRSPDDLPTTSPMFHPNYRQPEFMSADKPIELIGTGTYVQRYGFMISKFTGWRYAEEQPLPDESPTAAESEE